MSSALLLLLLSKPWLCESQHRFTLTLGSASETSY